jgi:hypothetical protein
MKKDTIPLCPHGDLKELCLDCKMNFLRQNGDAFVPRAEILQIIEMLLNKINRVEDNCENLISERCPPRYDPQWD